MKKFSELSDEILAYEIAVQVQEGNINEEELEELQEALPLIPIAAKLISGGLGMYSAYSAAKNLRKGKYKQAGLDALGMIPGGKVFKGARALGAGKNLAKLGSFAQSATRYNVTGKTPTAFSKAVDTGFDAVGHALKGRNPFNKKLYQKTNKQPNKPPVVKPPTSSSAGAAAATSAPKAMSFKGGMGYSTKKTAKV